MSPLMTSKHVALSVEQLDRARRDYAVERLALIDHAFGADPWARAAESLFVLHGQRIDRPAAPDYPRLDPRTLDFGGAYRHTLVTGDTLRAELAGIETFYADAVDLASEVVDRPCIKSPYPRSAITLKLYEAGDVQGFHLDTNPVSVLAAVTDCPVGGELIVHTFDGGRRVIRMCAGDILIFDGRSMPHVVLTQPLGAHRVLLSFNTYHPDDTWRPEGIDRVMFAG